jgi:hypothetical protein
MEKNVLELTNKIKNIVLIVEGGIGKNISATAVVRALKKAYSDKKIIVVAGCPEVFFYNTNVYRPFNFSNPLYFYDDFINDETVILKVEPYLDYGYVNKEKHVVESWCDQLGIECDGVEPDLYFLDNELEMAKFYVEKIQDNTKKEMILLQWIGGKVPEDKSNDKLKMSLMTMFRRSLPLIEIEKVVNYLKDKYVIGNVGHNNFPEIKNTNIVFFPIRSTLALLPYVKTFVGIDSFLQHAAAAKQINKKGIVLWGGTSPKCLGYNVHINITKKTCNTPLCHRPNSYLFDAQANGAMWSCMHNEKCLKYTAEEIIKIFEDNFQVIPIETIKKEEVPSTCGKDCNK